MFVVAGFLVAIQDTSAIAAVAGRDALLKQQVNDESAVVPVVVVRRGRAAVGPRGNAVVRRSTVVRPGVRPVRPGVRPDRWVRPGWYRWPPGGAIAAGAAIGVVAAATAAAWAGSPPAPGYCWYYTDPSQRQGFWDVCQ
ncbi:MAG: hypothetical protein V4602_20340 [Pseudomonadota bacterium]